MAPKLLLDGLVPVLEVLEGEVAGDELGVVGAVLVLREEQIVRTPPARA